jgi:ferritin-like metal-binding protein YciE
MKNDTARDLLVTGLRNAHAMERQAQELMERQSEDTKDYPDVLARLKEHLQETRTQMKRLQNCLKELGESESTLKDMTMATVANITAMGHSMAGDAILKNTFANNAFEHYEIAAYKSLLALCEKAGIDFAEPLTASLREEERMASWVDAHVKDVTLRFLANEERAAA